MTIQRRVLFGLEDIKAIICQCLHCESRLSLVPNNVKAIPPQCPHCSAQWISPPDQKVKQSVPLTSPYLDFVSSLNGLLNMKQINRKQNAAETFQLLLEFEEPS